MFDASVLAALVLGREAVASRLRPVLREVLEGHREGHMSLVNAAELQYVAGDRLGIQGQDVLGFLKAWRISAGGVNYRQALLAAQAKSTVRDFSLGDAFAFALAVQRRGRLWTTDSAFDHPWIRRQIAVTLLPRR